MRNSYIANSSEALNLHNGSQTAIVLAMKVQPTPNKFNPQNVDYRMTKGKNYCAGTNHSIESLNDSFFGILDCAPYSLVQDVYVRESWCMPDDEYFYKANGMQKHEHYLWDGIWKSPAIMPKSAVRTRFKIVGCEAVRVKDMEWNQVCNLGFASPYTFELYFISKFGQSAWDNNDYIWFYKIEKI